MKRSQTYIRDMNAASQLRAMATQLRGISQRVALLPVDSEACRLIGIHGKEIDGAADTLVTFAEGVEAMHR